MRGKTSITLPAELLEAIDKIAENRSVFLERAAIVYLTALDRRRREERDLEIINRNSKRLNKETKDVLGYQRWPLGVGN